AAGCQAEAVQLAQELAGRVVLILGRQLRSERERLVENPRVRVGEQQAGGLAVFVAFDDSAGRFGRVLRVTDGSQRRTIEQRAVVQVQNEDRRIRSGFIQLGQRRQPSF